MNNIIGIKIKDLEDGEYVILKDWSILKDEDYVNALKENKISPSDVNAIVHSIRFPALKTAELLYPSLIHADDIAEVVLSRHGFYLELFDLYYVFPANPQYLIYIVNKEQTTLIEIINVNEIIKVINADKIIERDTVGKELSIYEYHEIRKTFLTETKIGGYSLVDVKDLLHRYFNERELSLEKEVEKIVNEYYKVFKPLRFYF